MGTTRKTNDQLARELGSAKRELQRLKKQNAERAGEEERFREMANHLSERLKELNCLYSISRIHETPTTSVDDVLQKILDIIPPALQYPDIACASLMLRNRRYSTAKFVETPWRMRRQFVLNNGYLCSLVVCYLNQGHDCESATFLEEEERLLDAIQDQVKSKLELHFEVKRAEKHQEQLVQLDKMVALGTLVSGVAHEINNPNNFIMLNTPLLAEAWRGVLPIMDEYFDANGDFLVGGLNYSEIRDNIGPLFEGITDGADRIKAIVEGLKSFARADTAELTPGIDVNETVRAALFLVNNQVKRATEDLRVQYGDNLPKLLANGQRLEQVWVNLIQNACESLPSKQKGIFVSTSYEEREACVLVEVRDQGCGIPDEKLQKVMDPFFTTKRDAGGTGLGLAISSGIVRSHGGTLSLASNGEGTVATVRLPKVDTNQNGREAGG
ncbi:sensor histidine kinase [Myxococcota bacterium]